jgi:hypothetical protein
VLEPAIAVHGGHLGVGDDLDVRACLDAVDQVARHRRGEIVPPNDDPDAARGPRQVKRGLACRVAAPDNDHVLATAALGVGGHDVVIDACPGEPLHVVRVKRAPARARGDHDRAGERVLPVVEVHAHEPLGAARELDGAVEA